MVKVRNSKLKAAVVLFVSIIVILSVVAGICLYHYIGIPKAVGDKEYKYKVKEISTEYNGITLYGKALIPIMDNEQKFKSVIYAHGANSNYKSDMTTLKSLAKSGVACYTFDFYGWTSKSTGPKGVKWFKGTPKKENDSYVNKVLQQVDDLNAVIKNVKSFDFVDESNIYLLGSSMGGVTVATCAATHTDEIKGIILQYPAIFLNEQAYETGAKYNVSNFKNRVLILQGNNDKIVPDEYSTELCNYYNSENEGQCQMIIYDGQPHVFTGKYKVIAAKDIYNFVKG